MEVQGGQDQLELYSDLEVRREHLGSMKIAYLWILFLIKKNDGSRITMPGYLSKKI